MRNFKRLPVIPALQTVTGITQSLVQHRQNVEKVVSQETHQNYKAERTTKAQTFEQSKRTTEHTEKNRNLVMKKGQKKK